MEDIIERYHIRNCVFAYRCTADWEKLDDTGVEQVRYCGECRRTVHLCMTDEELTNQVRANNCVACPPLPKADSMKRSFMLGFIRRRDEPTPFR